MEERDCLGFCPRSLFEITRHSYFIGQYKRRDKTAKVNFFVVARYSSVN